MALCLLFKLKSYFSNQILQRTLIKTRRITSNLNWKLINRKNSTSYCSIFSVQHTRKNFLSNFRELENKQPMMFGLDLKNRSSFEKKKKNSVILKKEILISGMVSTNYTHSISFFLFAVIMWSNWVPRPVREIQRTRIWYKLNFH